MIIYAVKTTTISETQAGCRQRGRIDKGVVFSTTLIA